MTAHESLETFRCRIYTAPVIVEIQCAHCAKIATDTEPGQSREAVRALRGRLSRDGWIVADLSDDDDEEAWQSAADYCSAACRDAGPGEWRSM